MRRVWDRIWYAPESPRNLAAARIIIAVHALWILFSRDFPGLAALPTVFWRTTSTLERWRYLFFPGHALLEAALYWMLVGALVAVTLGWRVRAAAFIAALLLYHVAPLEALIWTPDAFERGFEVTILSLLVLSAARCGDVWSLDAPAVVPAPGAEYHWPLVLIQLFVVQIYFFSGYSKLYRVGLSWMTADNMQRWLVRFSQEDQLQQVSHVGLWIAHHAAVSQLVAIGAVLLDLSMILCVVWKPARRVLIPAAISMHVGIFLTMSIVFLNAPQLLVFVNWNYRSKRTP